LQAAPDTVVDVTHQQIAEAAAPATCLKLWYDHHNCAVPQASAQCIGLNRAWTVMLLLVGQGLSSHDVPTQVSTLQGINILSAVMACMFVTAQ
jgi:hypothetical protein